DECLGICAGFAQGPIGSTIGNTLGCRASWAMSTNPNRCDAAGVGGGQICGTTCEVYCDYSARACTGANQLFADTNTCMSACQTFLVNNGAVGSPTILYCRDRFLARAVADPSQAATNCAQAKLASSSTCGGS